MLAGRQVLAVALFLSVLSFTSARSTLLMRLVGLCCCTVSLGTSAAGEADPERTAPDGLCVHGEIATGIDLGLAALVGGAACVVDSVAGLGAAWAPAQARPLMTLKNLELQGDAGESAMFVLQRR